MAELILGLAMTVSSELVELFKHRLEAAPWFGASACGPETSALGTVGRLTRKAKWIILLAAAGAS